MKETKTQKHDKVNINKKRKDCMVKEGQKNNAKESQVNAKAVKESHDEVENLKDDLMVEQLDNNKRKVALMCSLMLNMVFVITAYAILCSDGTGQTFGRLLGVNM